MCERILRLRDSLQACLTLSGRLCDGLFPIITFRDVQNDFLPPTGKLAVDNGRDILPHVQHLLDENRNWPWIKVIASQVTGISLTQLTVVSEPYPNFTWQDYHPPGHISFTTTHLGFEDKPFQTINVKTPQRDDIEQILWPEHCVRCAWTMLSSADVTNYTKNIRYKEHQAARSRIALKNL